MAAATGDSKQLESAGEGHFIGAHVMGEKRFTQTIESGEGIVIHVTDRKTHRRYYVAIAPEGLTAKECGSEWAARLKVAVLVKYLQAAWATAGECFACVATFASPKAVDRISEFVQSDRDLAEFASKSEPTDEDTALVFILRYRDQFVGTETFFVKLDLVNELPVVVLTRRVDLLQDTLCEVQEAIEDDRALAKFRWNAFSGKILTWTAATVHPAYQLSADGTEIIVKQAGMYDTVVRCNWNSSIAAGQYEGLHLQVNGADVWCNYVTGSGTYCSAEFSETLLLKVGDKLKVVTDGSRALYNCTGGTQFQIVRRFK